MQTNTAWMNLRRIMPAKKEFVVYRCVGTVCYRVSLQCGKADQWPEVMSQGGGKEELRFCLVPASRVQRSRHLRERILNTCISHTSQHSRGGEAKTKADAFSVPSIGGVVMHTGRGG